MRYGDQYAIYKRSTHTWMAGRYGSIIGTQETKLSLGMSDCGGDMAKFCKAYGDYETVTVDSAGEPVNPVTRHLYKGRAA